jgi:hypothetical protein
VRGRTAHAAGGTGDDDHVAGHGSIKRCQSCARHGRAFCRSQSLK